MLKFWILMVLFSQTLLADYVEPHIKHTAYCQMKVVVPLTSRDPMIQEEKLLNVTNMFGAVQKWGGSLEARIVLYGAGVTLLQNPSPETKESIDTLRSVGVQFLVCNNTLLGKKLDWHTLYGVKETDIIPSGALEVVSLQSCHGYVVGPLN